MKTQSKARILIVEDDRIYAKLLSSLLQQKGMDYEWAASLRSARKKLTEEIEFTLVLLDNELPDGRGFALMRDLNRYGQQLPVILLTASEDKALMHEYLQAGVADYMIKPVNVHLLLAKVERLIHFHQLNRHLSRKPFKLDKNQPSRILLVSNQEAVLAHFSLLLQDDPYFKLIQVTSFKGIETLLSEHGLLPDLVLLDSRLAAGRGYVSIGRCRKLLPGIPIILVTEEIENLEKLTRLFRVEVDGLLHPDASREQARLALGFALLRAKRDADAYLSSLVFRHANEGIVIADAETVILDVNPAFSVITGWSREEAIGQKTHLLNSGQQSKSFYQKLWQELKDQGYWRGELLNRHKEGRFYWELLTLSAVTNALGQVTNYVALISDITQQKQQQELLTQMNSSLAEQLEINQQSLEERNADLLEFNRALTHHFQEPVRRLQIFANQLSKPEALQKPEAKKAVQFIEQQARQLSRLVKDVKKYLDLEAPVTRQPRFEPLHSCLQVALQNLGMPLQQVEVHLPSDLPQVAMDADKLILVLTLLLDNARRYSKPETPLLISLTAQVEGQRLHVRLADNGPGIPESQREEVFTLFRRLASSETEGTGVGLPLARKLIRQVGGQLWIDDSHDQGACFVFDLPWLLQDR